MTSNLRIGGAIGLGIVIILGAFYVKGTIATQVTGTVVSAEAPERNYIELRDSDGDGRRDWEEDLEGDAFATIATPTSTLIANPSEAYTPPSTLTGKFSEAFLQDYLSGKMKGQEFTDPTEFVKTAVGAIEANTQSIKHSRQELRIVSDSPEAKHEYGNHVSFAILANINDDQSVPEAYILQQALESSDPEKLKKLEPFYTFYTRALVELLSMDVPASYVNVHLNLLNSFESMLTNNVAMQVAFNDPILALAHIQKFQTEPEQLFAAFREISELLTSQGVMYSDEEFGIFFRNFEI